MYLDLDNAAVAIIGEAKNDAETLQPILTCQINLVVGVANFVLC